MTNLLWTFNPNPCRLTNRIFTTTGRGKASKNKWIITVKSDMKQLKIPLETIQDRSKFRQITLQGVFPVPLTSKKSTGTNRPNWTEERKLAHRQKIKVFWAERKQKTRVKGQNEPRGPK